MHVLNIHERILSSTPERAAWLLDSLSSPGDVLWPSKHWPRMRLNKPLGLGASGGHGPIRYFVIAYEPGKKIDFQFTEPRGFLGMHRFEILPHGKSGATLRHTIDMSLVGLALLSWPVAFRPLHDALVEDALTNAQVALGEQPTPVAWSVWVRLLRKAVGRRGKRRGDA